MELKNIEKQEKSIVVLTIAVSAAELEVGKQAAFKKNGKNITVPGFRKGKAPRQIIEKLYGTGMFVEDAINMIYPKIVDEAIVEAKLDQVGPADVEMKEFHEDGSFEFTASVPVAPEVTVGEYKGVEIEKDDVKVLVADVKAELERMAQRGASTETVERAAANGDTAVIDFEGFVDGVAFEGGKGEDHDLVLGSNSFIPGFEEQLVGKKAGEEVDVNVTFPTEYHAADLAGKEAIFKCTIKEVKAVIVPKIDDEFAKDVSETAETLDDLKKEVKERLVADKQAEVDHAFEESLIDAVIAAITADAPEVMIEQQVDNIVQDFAYRLQMQGMQLDQYMQMSGMDKTAFRGMFKAQAERQVNTRLALAKIAEVENLEIDDETLEKEYAEMAENYKMDVEKVKELVKADALRGDLRLTKALEFVKDNAKVIKKKKKAEETEAAE